MDVWLVRNGKTSGPFPDYEVRRQITEQQLTAIDYAWHDGLNVWKPLAEIELFRSAFETQVSRKPSAASVPPPLPFVPRLLRRFIARWFDLSLYSSIWWAIMFAAGRDIPAVATNLWIMLPHYVPYFILEAFLLHHFQTTPGKWLLGLSVRNTDGSALDLAASTRRAARVLFSGIGFGWDLLVIFCQLMSFFTTRKLGRPLWDHLGGHQLLAETLRPARIIVLSILFAGSLASQMVTLAPAMLRYAAENNPEVKAELEKNPLWQLLKRP
jgi:uncharacterized RDD family membrane protein YckC